MPYEVFRAADRDLILAVGNDRQFAAFCQAAGRPELAEDPRFGTNPDRVRNRLILVPIVQEIMRERDSGDWILALSAAGVPCGLINDIAEVFQNPQVEDRGLRVEIPHPAGVPCPTVSSPMRFSATPITYDRPPPRLGQHTDEVLREILGLSEAEIARLSTHGVI